MIWLIPLAAGAGIGWLLARSHLASKQPAAPTRVLTAAEAQAAYGTSPYAGDTSGSSIEATGLPGSALGLTGRELPLLSPPSLRLDGSAPPFSSGLGALVADVYPSYAAYADQRAYVAQDFSSMQGQDMYGPPPSYYDAYGSPAGYDPNAYGAYGAPQGYDVYGPPQGYDVYGAPPAYADPTFVPNAAPFTPSPYFVAPPPGPSAFVQQPAPGMYGPPPDPYAQSLFQSPFQPYPAQPFPSQGAPPQPIAVLRCAADRCWVRPQPIPWDDRMGRQDGAFSAPRGHVFNVLAFGPVGWAHVLVQHPDDGLVEGWVETRFLENAQQPQQQPQQSQQAPQQQSQQGQQQGQQPPPPVPGGVNAAAVQRTAEFLARRGQTLVGIGAPPGTGGAAAGMGSAFAAPTITGRSRRHRRPTRRAA